LPLKNELISVHSGASSFNIKLKSYLATVFLYALPLGFFLILTRDFSQDHAAQKKVAEIYEDDHLIITGLGNNS